MSELAHANLLSTRNIVITVASDGYNLLSVVRLGILTLRAWLAVGRFIRQKNMEIINLH